MLNDPDLIYIIGLVVGFLAFPALLSAFSESRPPRTAAIMVMIAAGLVVTALIQKPSGYSFGQTPQIFMDVVSRYLK